MCTVTVIPASDGWRLACNRDELRTRAEATPPTVHTIAVRSVLMPVDPPSGGTWIAVNDTGLAFVLINLNEGPALPAKRDAMSRGLVIPALASCATLDEFGDRAARFDTHPFAPFRLATLDRHRCVLWRSTNGRMEAVAQSAVSAPLFFTSSGLGDNLVEGPRRALFVERLFSQAWTSSAQNAFHAHKWSDRSHLSVCMSREDARTVSVTTVELTSTRVTMHYRAIGGETAPSVDMPIGSREAVARV